MSNGMHDGDHSGAEHDEAAARPRRKGIYILPNLFTLAAVVYCSCAALRLTRFNTNLTVVDKRFFHGLPSPAAAALVIGFIWLMDNQGYKGGSEGRWLQWTTFGFTLYAGLTMVTNVPF